jgi:hypothetical protein
LDEIGAGDSTLTSLATSDYLQGFIEDIGDSSGDSPHDYLDEWRTIVNLNPTNKRLAYIVPPGWSRAIRDSMPFWGGLMRELHSWDEDDGVCVYWVPDTAGISQAGDSTDNYLVINNESLIRKVDSRTMGLGQYTGAVRYNRKSDGAVSYHIFDGFANNGLTDTLYLLNATNPEAYPRMGSTQTHDKVAGDTVLTMKPWGFNIVSVAVDMTSGRPTNSGVGFEDILADSAKSWIDSTAVVGSPDTTIFSGIYFDLLGESALQALIDSSMADTTGINDYLQEMWDTFGDDYDFGGNSQQVDHIRSGIMSKFDMVTAGELDRPDRFSGTYNQIDYLMEDLILIGMMMQKRDRGTE